MSVQLSLAQIKANLLSFSPNQKGHHNNNCDAKLLNLTQGRMTTAQVNVVDSTMNAINSLSTADFNTLNASLPGTNKLRHDPC